jgi:4-hydroxy-3-polyprenylbenzoate decarboxylase
VVQSDLPVSGAGQPDEPLQGLCRFWEQLPLPEGIALVVVVDDAVFCSRQLNNFLWVTFTRSNPAADLYGVGATTRQRHWGCSGPLVIDARKKPFHAPPLEDDPAVERRIDELIRSGGPLHGLL